MGMVLVLVMWLLAPFAELCIIIGLAVMNSRHKKKIQALTAQLEERKRAGCEQPQPSQENAQWVVPGMEQRYEPRMSGYAPAPLSVKPRHRVVEPGFSQGTAALIIGVVFVVLAGLIFATTTWHILSSSWKVVLVFGFAALFFGASRAADKVFKIKKTCQAFYILGCVFLFITVLAAGYFGLLGPELALMSGNRWRVLWVGSVVTELVLFAGLRKFSDRIYTQACLWGMTVSLTFLLGAFQLESARSLCCMAGYSFLLLVWDDVRKRRQGKEERWPETLAQSFGPFAEIHFYIFSGLMVLQAVMELLWIIAGGILTVQSGVGLWGALSLGMVAGGTGLQALRRPSPNRKVLHSAVLALFFQYAGGCVQADYTYQILAGALSASASVLMFAAVTAQWSRHYPVIRGLLPIILFPLTMTGTEIMGQAAGLNVEYDGLVFVYLLGIFLWDVFKKERFCAAVLVIGTGIQLVYMVTGTDTYPFFMLLAAGLFVRSSGREGSGREWCINGGFLYTLAGIFVIAGSVTDNGVMRMMWVAAFFGLEYAAICRGSRECAGHWFWDITGAAVSVLTMLAFYSGHDLELWNMGPCLIVCAVIYVILYRRGRIWPHLAVALAALPLPMAVWARYSLTEHLIYGCTAAALLVSGCLARRYWPVVEMREEGNGSWNADWFHILAVLVMLWVILTAGSEWGCVYMFLAALYALQYAGLVQWRKQAITLSAAITVLALWIQPFITWPEIAGLEARLAPVVLFTWSLSCIWKNKQWLPMVQTVLYGLCLAAMAGDAFLTGNVADALILEAVCLAVFIWAHISKCTRWLRISGVIIITVALYMTKGFWLSLSWWVYLLAAGLGLILFAAFNEMKKP